MSWIVRDIEKSLAGVADMSLQPVKVLKGPRQVGKTSLLLKGKGYRFISLDDLSNRRMATENPSFFLDQWDEPILQ
jgi:predicted AAA+ superfamily ATPase